jgi:hypothetical protein
MHKLSPESCQKLRWCLVIGFFVVQVNASYAQVFVVFTVVAEMVHND